LPAGAVLLTSRATIGFTAVSKVPISTNQGFVNFVCGPRIQPEYLAYWLRAKKPTLERLANGATFKEISRGTVRKLEIKVPDRAEQARVVDLLSRAENMVRMRREAEQRAKEIIPALFLDMFGDPGTNPKGWGIESLAEVAAIESPLQTPNFVTEATEVCIGPDSIESMTGQLLSQPTVGDIRPISGKYRYRCRDVLYSKIRPALVKVALAPSDGYCSADMYPLRCGPKLQPEYLMQILLNRHFTRYALDRATRAQMPKINREALFAFRLPVPSIDLQESFARHCQGYMRVREQQRTAMGTAELAFQSLLARVFGE
jgi:type I restriction enzyme S subunit